MNQTLLIHYSGKTIETTVTSNPSIAKNWISNIQSIFRNQKIKIVGLNCKWKPHPIQSMSGSVDTLQLCVDTKCLVLQISHMMPSIPDSIKDFLSDPDVVFTGIEMMNMVSKLKVECGRKIDVRCLVKMHFPLSFRAEVGLKALAFELLGLSSWRPEKGAGVKCGEMGRSVLDLEQIKFACVDAYVCYKIGHKLLTDM